MKPKTENELLMWEQHLTERAAALTDVLQQLEHIRPSDYFQIWLNAKLVHIVVDLFHLKLLTEFNYSPLLATNNHVPGKGTK